MSSQSNTTATSSPSLEQEEQFRQQLFSTRSIAYCLLTLIILEILFTFNKEIIYVWRRPGWSFFKVFYILCRYLPIVPTLIVIVPFAPSDAYCTFVAWYLGLVNTIFTVWPSSCLLAIRLDRLYASKSIRKILITLVLAEGISILVVGSSTVTKEKLSYVGEPVNNCVGHVSGSFWLAKSLIFLPYLSLACAYIAIAWYAFIRHCREKASLSSIWAVRKIFAPLYVLLIRDGLVCYIINTFGILCGFLLLTVPSKSSELVLVGPVVISVVTSMSCCRLVLLLHGDPGYATGVYVDSTEVHVEMMKLEESSTCASFEAPRDV